MFHRGNSPYMSTPSAGCNGSVLQHIYYSYSVSSVCAERSQAAPEATAVAPSAPAPTATSEYYYQPVSHSSQALLRLYFAHIICGVAGFKHAAEI